ncbi:MAG: hypothetical protein R2827_11290 [Bdellovibrionales bacterium]
MPVISGNVSLYNKAHDTNVTSTPSTGIIGLKDDINSIPKDEFVREGDRAFLIRCDLWQGEFYKAEILGGEYKFAGDWNAEKLRNFLNELRRFVIKYKPRTSVAVGKLGGLFELQKMSSKGFSVHLSGDLLETLTKEHLYEVILTVSDRDALEEFWSDRNFEVIDLGTVIQSELRVEGQPVVDTVHWTQTSAECIKNHFGLE